MIVATEKARVKRNIPLLYWFNFLTDFRLYGPFAIIYFSDIAGSFALGMVFAIAAFLVGSLADAYGTQFAMVTAILIQALVIPIYVTLFRTSK